MFAWILLSFPLMALFLHQYHSVLIILLHTEHFINAYIIALSMEKKIFIYRVGFSLPKLLYISFWLKRNAYSL